MSTRGYCVSIFRGEGFGRSGFWMQFPSQERLAELANFPEIKNEDVRGC
jgi:hypothetical protein